MSTVRINVQGVPIEVKERLLARLQEVLNVPIRNPEGCLRAGFWIYRSSPSRLTCSMTYNCLARDSRMAPGVVVAKVMGLVP